MSPVRANVLSFDLSIHGRDCDCDALEFHAVRIAVRSVLSSSSFFLSLEVLLRYDFFSQVTWFTGCDRVCPNIFIYIYISIEKTHK